MIKSKNILILVFITILIDMLGVGILIPIFPLLVASNSIYKITPIHWSIEQGYIMLGWLVGSYSIAQFISAPILGQLSDKYGRKRILALSFLGTSFSYIIFAIGLITKNIPLLFISRILDGATGGNISIAQSIIADISLAKDRAKNFGLVGVALGLGYVLGPFIGGKLSESSIVSWFNITTPYYFATIISLINCFMLLIFLPETIQKRNLNSLNLYRSFENIFKALTNSSMKKIIFPLFLFLAGFTFYTTFWGVVLAEKFNFTSSSKIGDYFAYVGIMIIFAQGLFVRKLSGKIEESKVLKLSILGSGITIICYYLIPSNKEYLIYFLPPLLALFIATTKAFSNSLIIKSVEDELRGQAMGINASSNALAQAIPAILAGYVAIQHFSLPILFGGIITILGGVVFNFSF